jgi:hypothetical protein
MALTISAQCYAAIKAKIMRRKVDALAAEIAATDWNGQPRFDDVDDLLRFADSLCRTVRDLSATITAASVTSELASCTF